MSERDMQKVVDISIFRQVMHRTFCEKSNETDRCPLKCPAHSRNLTLDNWGKLRIGDLLVVKKNTDKRRKQRNVKRDQN